VKLERNLHIGGIGCSVEGDVLEGVFDCFSAGLADVSGVHCSFLFSWAIVYNLLGVFRKGLLWGLWLVSSGGGHLP
jgi:hypothetical protein